MAPKISQLRQLLDVLTKSVNDIELEASKNNVTYPSIDDVYVLASGGEQFAMKPSVLQAATLGASAASQIVATLKIPGMSLFDRAMAFHISAAIRVATEAGVVELLRESPSGLHIKEIGARTNTDPSLIGRVMRILATHYVFREVEPDVFTNNRISSLIDTGKPSEMIFELTKKKYANAPVDTPLVKNIQVEKFLNTSGVAAIVEQITDEGYKSAAYMTEYILGSDKSLLPFNRGMHSKLGLFEFMDIPEHKGYMGRMQAAFEGSSQLEPITTIVQGFDWTTLPESALVVDLGGGNGSVSFIVAETVPKLRFVLQDRLSVIDNVARPAWNADPAKKRLLDSGKMILQVHDFFEPQPSAVAGKVDVFLLRYIVHDWQNDAALKILRHLRAAVAPKGRLLIVDQIVPYACPAPNVGRDIAGAALPLPPAPLLANLGMANTKAYFADMQMMSFLGAQERTLGEFMALTAEAGWKIVKVYWPPGSSLQHMECVKI